MCQRGQTELYRYRLIIFRPGPIISLHSRQLYLIITATIRAHSMWLQFVQNHFHGAYRLRNMFLLQRSRRLAL